MKYLLWFYLYTLNNEPQDIRTYIGIYKDSIEFYVYEFKYVKWKIDVVLEETYRSDKFYTGGKYKYDYFRGSYLVSFKDLKAIVFIEGRWAEIIILGNYRTDHIVLSKDRMRNHKYK